MVSDPDSNALCLECGLCCNGVIFADVQLERGDDASRLQALGLQPVSRGRSRPRFLQPCAAFGNCRCRIYVDRPKYCREFECLLLKDVKAGRTGKTAALRTIRLARWRARQVKNLLRKLGDTDDRAALNLRVRRVNERLLQTAPDAETAATFGELSIAVHDLTLLLSKSFYRL